MRSHDTQLAVGCVVDTSAREFCTMLPALYMHELTQAELTALEEKLANVHNLAAQRLHDIRAERDSRELARAEAEEEAQFCTH